MGGQAGFSLGLGIANTALGAVSAYSQGQAAVNAAKYNAAALRREAVQLEDRNELMTYLVRQQYLHDYQQLQADQDRQQSYNRVLQAKNGISGASAAATMQSYAGKAQKNLDTLYYNAAMQVGSNTLDMILARNAVLEKAAQYDWQAKQARVAQAVGVFTSLAGGLGNTLLSGSDVTYDGAKRNDGGPLGKQKNKIYNDPTYAIKNPWAAKQPGTNLSLADYSTYFTTGEYGYHAGVPMSQLQKNQASNWINSTVPTSAFLQPVNTSSSKAAVGTLKLLS